MSDQLYPSDLTDQAWEELSKLLPAAKIGGRPRRTDLRLVVNGILYLLCGGIAWRSLPRKYPPWQTVYGYFRRWSRQGDWQRINDCLRRRLRERAGRHRQASAAILDSQSVKAPVGSERGYDAGKKIKGRKRHILVDTLGLLIVAVVHAASIQDRDGPKQVLCTLRHRFSRLRVIWADGAYAGALINWTQTLRDRRRLRLEIVQRTSTGFVALPRRWIVERTVAWLTAHRRLSKDYERLPETSTAFLYLAMIRLMIRRPL